MNIRIVKVNEYECYKALKEVQTNWSSWKELLIPSFIRKILNIERKYKWVDNTFYFYYKMNSGNFNGGHAKVAEYILVERLEEVEKLLILQEELSELRPKYIKGSTYTPVIVGECSDGYGIN